MMNFDPPDVIVPLCCHDPKEQLLVFCGTAFFLDEGGFLVTAAHCVEGLSGAFEIGAGKGDMLPGGRVPRGRHQAEVVDIDGDADLALLRVQSYRPGAAIRLFPGEVISTNQFVMTYEYSTTRAAESMFMLEPATRIGNITRTTTCPCSRPKAAQSALELSFPALRGASGAPVLDWRTWQLLGVVVANSSYHLLPAQIETVLDANNEILEETKYMLPLGIAVNVRHLKDLLTRQQK